MKKLHLFIFFSSFSCVLAAQESFIVRVKDQQSNQSLTGVSVQVKETKSIHVTNDSGYVYFTGLAKGIYHLVFTNINYKPLTISVSLPDSTEHEVALEKEDKTLENVVILSTTRNEQRIENSPLKVEVLGREELDEENTIKPANIASLLSDVSGIQIQQSSAVSGNANVRIQGLEGRYTQILRDGMPLFEGFSGGFGVLTIPPLDLRQIELVKGSASTLYGGGAIGGLVNLISKRPSLKQEAVVTLNQSTLKESNGNIYLAKRGQHTGYTLFSGYTHQDAVDVNDDGFTDLPRLRTFILHPRIYLYPSTTTSIILGYTGSFEKRKGGDLLVLKRKQDNLHQFFENNETRRHTGELLVEQNLPHKVKASLKASASSFDRDIRSNSHFFSGNQLNYFTEASMFVPAGKTDWVAGINLIGDRFIKRSKSGPTPITNFSNNTVGAFTQLTMHLPTNTLLETGLRLDHHNEYGSFWLPRLALFHRFSEVWATRLGFGMGYKTPNALAPQTTDYAIEQIHPITPGTKAEVSYGINAEINFKKEWDKDKSIFINHAFFHTSLQDPIVANEQYTGEVYFSNKQKPIVSKGFDTYMQLVLSGWEIYAGYTFTIVERKYLSQNQFMPLTPKNRAAFTLVKEITDNWRFGLEGSYTGNQFRDNDTRTPGYLFIAAMVERKFGKHISLVLNGENLLDYRQSKNEALYTGSITTPQFKPIWAPIDGRVINLCLRVSL